MCESQTLQDIENALYKLDILLERAAGIFENVPHETIERDQNHERIER